MSKIDYNLVGYLDGQDDHNVPLLYELYQLRLGEELRGEYYLEIIDGDRRISISNFGGTRSTGMVPRNSTIVTSTLTGEILHYHQNLNTSFIHYAPPQGVVKKPHYEDFFEAIEVAILKRIPKQEDIYVFLSSGHDSGIITSALINCDVPFKVLSIVGNESTEVLESRWNYLRDSEIEGTKIGTNGPFDKKKYRQYEKQYRKDGFTEPFKEVCSHYIASKHLPEGSVLFSGLGADEMYVSRDDELLNRFLTTSKTVYDYFKLDVRYPLLDYEVFKEYYSLEPQLRRRWKQPFEKYMQQIRFPVNNGNKVGFYVFDDY
tara:strand:+ start:4404 stop:5354 length:951 start_codon:yes stop_codon:yes gene_type:complete